jgi:hypothetical protein
VWRGGFREIVKEGEYGGNTMHTCMYMEKWYLSKLFQEWGKRRDEGK